MISRLRTKNPHQVTILLVDDQPTVRYGLRMVLQLEAGAAAIYEAGTADEAFVFVAHYKPDIVIMDVEMPGMDGIVATERLMAMRPACVVIILTIHNCPEVRARAMAAGARAFVEKGRPEELRMAFRQSFAALGAQEE